MALTSQIKRSLNVCLAPLNLRLETLTADKVEEQRLAELNNRQQFESPRFQVGESFGRMDPGLILREVQKYRESFSKWTNPQENSVGYSFANQYFSSPDAEVLYSVIRTFKPATIVEVGSGNSTRVSRLAIQDASLRTKLVSIDPSPRLHVRSIADQVIESQAEFISDPSLLTALEANDILFIDSSHFIRPGNDVVFLYLEVIPRLKPGVLIHIHDIFLPYDYPYAWIQDKSMRFDEQYLVALLLNSRNDMEVLWAGHFLQRSMPDFDQYFPKRAGRLALSLWLRVGAK